MSERHKGRLGNVVTAMVTPFDEGGKLDLGAAVDLARHLAAHGSDAIVVTGTTGESPTLSDQEKLDLWHTLAEASTIPVVAGSTTNDTAHSIELTRAAEQAGAAAILAVTPYYSRPPQSGLARHFAAVAEATSLPVYLYDIPSRTGRKIATATMVRLAREVANIVGVKDAAGNPAETGRLLAEEAGFEVYSGDDVMTLPLLAVGAVGVVSVAAHWVGDEIADMVDSFLSGDVERARHLNAAIVDAVTFQSSDEAPNPMPAKAMLRAMGLSVGDCRLPLGPTAWLDEQAGAVLADIEAWRASHDGAAGA